MKPHPKQLQQQHRLNRQQPAAKQARRTFSTALHQNSSQR